MKQSVGEKASNIVIALGVGLIVILTFDFIFKVILGDMSPLPHFSKEIPPFPLIFTALITAPIFEEMIFRYAPLELLKSTQIFRENKWLIVFLIGILFGWLHGNYYNVYCQGVMGVAFGWVYIKNQMSYISAVVAHSLYNFLVIILIPTVVY